MTYEPNRATLRLVPGTYWHRRNRVAKRKLTRVLRVTRTTKRRKVDRHDWATHAARERASVEAKAHLLGWLIRPMLALFPWFGPLAMLDAAPAAPSLNGVRDPENPCEQYVEGKPEGDCEGDGHHMCRECARLVATPAAATERGAK